MKTKSERLEEAEKLKKLKDKVPAHGLIGDNHAMIDAQVEVLVHLLDEAAIWERNDPDITAEEEVWDDNTCSAATDARKWVEGKSSPPSEEWANLAKG